MAVKTLALLRKAVEETFRNETLSVRTFAEEILAVKTLALLKKAVEETFKKVILARVETFSDVTLPVRMLAFDKKAVPETFRKETLSVVTLAEVMFAVRTFALEIKAVPEMFREEIFALAIFPVVMLIEARKADEETFRNVTLAWVLTLRDVTFIVGALTLVLAVKTLTAATLLPMTAP